MMIQYKQQVEEQWRRLARVLQVELNPAATPQAPQQVVGTATTTWSQGTNEVEFGHSRTVTNNWSESRKKRENQKRKNLNKLRLIVHLNGSSLGTHKNVYC